MLTAFLLRWRKAKALSVLQNAYDLPLKEPLDGLADTDLTVVTKTIFQGGGNCFDAAAAFVALRIKCALESNLRLGAKIDSAEEDASAFALGVTRTRTMMRMYPLHQKAIHEIGTLRRSIAERDAGVA